MLIRKRPSIHFYSVHKHELSPFCGWATVGGHKVLSKCAFLGGRQQRYRGLTPPGLPDWKSAGDCWEGTHPSLGIVCCHVDMLAPVFAQYHPVCGYLALTKNLLRFHQGSISMFIKHYHSELRVSFALVDWMVICCPLKFLWADQLRFIAEVAIWQDFPKHTWQKMLPDVFEWTSLKKCMG